MTEEVKIDPTWNTVEGKTVLAREAVTHVTPVSGGNPVPLTGVHKILLDDETVLYQCVHAAFGCGKTFDSPQGVRGHLSSHSPARAKFEQLRQETVAQAQQLDAKDREIGNLRAQLKAANKRAGGIQAAVTRRAKQDAESQSPTTRSVPDEQVVAKQAAAMELWNAGVKMINGGVDKCYAAMRQLGELAQPVDPTLVAKAQRWDEMQRLLNDTTGK